MSAEEHFLTKVDYSIKAADEDFEAAIAAYKKYRIDTSERLAKLEHGSLRWCGVYVRQKGCSPREPGKEWRKTIEKIPFMKLFSPKGSALLFF